MIFFGRPAFPGVTRLSVNASICAVKRSLPKANPLFTLSLKGKGKFKTLSINML